MNDEINEDEVFEKQETKLQIFKNKKVVIATVVAILIIAMIALEFTTGIISNFFYSFFEKGNSVGNISNCGYSAEKGDYIYYVSPSENMETTNIYRVKKGTSDSETIYNGNYDIRSLNIVENKIYFIDIAVSENDEDIDNKIYRMNLDGSELTVINDNEFAYDSFEMYVIRNKIYYVGEDYNVYQMNLDGGNRELVLETGTGFLAINEKYIIYNKSNEDDSDYITYIREINGSDEKTITGSRIYTPDIYNGYIYYVNGKRNLAKISLNGGEEEIVCDGPIYNLNIYDGNIYYLNYKDEEKENYSVCIYRLNTSGGKPEIIKEFSYYSSFINIVNNYIYYMDMDDQKAFINLLNINDLNEIGLYEWSYGNNNESDDDTSVNVNVNQADISSEEDAQ